MMTDEARLRIIEVAPCRVAVIGELDLAGVPELEARLAACDGGDVALDCSGLTFVDAAGLGVLVRTQRACEDRGAKFVLLEPPRCLTRLLCITGLDEVLLFSFEAPQQ